MERIEQRLTKLEEKVSSQVTEPELRQILSDKLDPLKEDISEVRKQAEKITDLLLNK